MTETTTETPSQSNVEAPAFAMPNVHVGGMVLYKKGRGRGEQEYPAIVRKKFANSIELVVQGSNVRKAGVRHEADPYYKQRPHMIDELGCWVESPAEKRLVSVESVILELVADVADLKAAVQFGKGVSQATKPSGKSVK